MSAAKKNNFEEILIKVNKFINIDNDRNLYGNHFSSLQKLIINKLRVDKLFKILFNGHALQGSYADNLKVKKADEFDYNFLIKFPEWKLVKVEHDKQNPGNVHLNCSQVLNKIKDNPNHALVYKHLSTWVTANNYLNIEKFQSWVQGRFNHVFNQIGSELVINGKPVILRYSRQGPAHTVYVTGGIDYSVDFVPAIQMEVSMAIIPGITCSWSAIPKPIKPLKPNSTSFRPSYFDEEKKLMKDNKNLKNVLRMMKKFRDTHQNMNNLKSYYIKTLFLFKAKEAKTEFWNSSLSVLVVEMFDALKKTLLNKKLPCLWNKNLNLYKDFSVIQINEMLSCVQSVLGTLELGRAAVSRLDEGLEHRIYAIFLTSTELQSIFPRPKTTV